MPNQRDKNKKGLSVFISTEVKDSLVALAAERGITVTDLCVELFREELKRRGYKLEKSDDKSKQS